MIFPKSISSGRSSEETARVILSPTRIFFDEFPAVSVGWTITEENFLKENSTINFLKIFAGWGQLGNANVPFNAQQVNTNAGLEIRTMFLVQTRI